MTKQTIKLVINAELDVEQYADLSHALWSVAQAALGGSGRFTMETDAEHTAEQLNARWRQLGRDVPWS